jgi:hypothetical protein
MLRYQLWEGETIPFTINDSSLYLRSQCTNVSDHYKVISGILYYFHGGLCKADIGIKGERWDVLHALVQPDSNFLKLDLMADTLPKKLSLVLETNFVVLGLDLVFYGMLALLVVGVLSYLLNIGIYTILICFLLYYFFGISFTSSLTHSLTTSQ